MARTWTAALAAVLLLVCLAPAALAAVPDRPANRYVLDSAGVLSKATEEEIIQENQRIFDAYGAEVCVAAVDFFGGKGADTYAYTMFDRWGVGSDERNNGILLVLGVGEEDYYALSGYGIDDYFDGAKLDDMLYEYLEPDFAAEDYDAGVKRFFQAVVEELDSYYAGGTHNQAPVEEARNPYEDDGAFQLNTGRMAVRIVSLVIRVVVFILVIVFLINLLRRVGRGGGGGGGYRSTGGGSGFWRGMFVGSMMNNRRRNRWGAPPPPPPPPGGFGGRPFGGPGPGAPRPPSGGFGARPTGRPTSRPGGFSGGGHSGFGGAGRSSGSRSSGGRSSGGGFRSGGGSHGGGAGRRR